MIANCSRCNTEIEVPDSYDHLPTGGKFFELCKPCLESFNAWLDEGKGVES